MLRIRLTRVGKKNSPAYRLVVAEQKKAVKRKFIEIIGNYNPTLKPKVFVINKERAVFWMGKGAQPSLTVRNLMCDHDVLPKKNKIHKIFGKDKPKKALKEEPAIAPASKDIAKITDNNAQDQPAKTVTEEKSAEKIDQAEKSDQENPETKEEATEEVDDSKLEPDESTPAEEELPKDKKD